MALLSKIISALMVAIVTVCSALSIPAPSFGFRIEAEASVFETGDDMYTVIWSTSLPGSGYLTYSYGGTDYTVYDQVGGNILTLDTIHAVRVPKSHLDGNTYAYHSQHILSKQAYSAMKGKTVDSQAVEFAGYHGEENIGIMTVADIHGNPDPAAEAIARFETKPSFLVMDGDITSQMVTKDDFISILKYAHMYSGGNIPVVYVRGNHEPRGEFAPEMIKYFRTSTGGLYFTFNYGPLWSIVLDGGEDKADDHPEYSGLVDFRSYIAEETKWLSGVEAPDSQYKLAFVHKPSLDDLDGEKWLGMLSDLGIDAAISGHLHRLDLHFYEGKTSFYRFVIGQNSELGSLASMFTLSGNGIGVKVMNRDGVVAADESFPLN